MDNNFRFITTSYEDFCNYSKLISQLTSQFKKLEYSEYFTLIKNFKDIIMLLEIKGEVVGTIKIIFERKFYNNNCYVMHIEDVVVDEKYRGKGYGKMLINYAIQLSKDNNACYKIILDCSEEKKLFYEKCGFLNKNCGMVMRCND